jgi:hypothetical protein
MTIKDFIHQKLNFKHKTPNQPLLTLPIFTSALVVTLKAPCFEWINKYDGEDDLKPDEEESYVYLMPPYDDEEELLAEYIEERWEYIFENILHSWSENESKWPQKRNFELFKQWFDFKPSRNVKDTGAWDNE